METESNNKIIDHENVYVRAVGTKRFLNYLIDVAGFYVLAFGQGIILELLFPSSLTWLESDDFGYKILGRIASLFFYALYMSIIESAFNGKSLGKFFTRTRAVNLDGSSISASTAFARGFSRAVPFCAFSALGEPCIPWQDSWTNTMVIDEERSSPIKL